MTIRVKPDKIHTNITYRQALALGIQQGTAYWCPELRQHLIICTPYGGAFGNLTNVITEVDCEMSIVKQHMYLMQGRIPPKATRMRNLRVKHIDEAEAMRLTNFAVYTSLN